MNNDNEKENPCFDADSNDRQRSGNDRQCGKNNRWTGTAESTDDRAVKRDTGCHQQSGRAETGDHKPDWRTGCTAGCDDGCRRVSENRHCEQADRDRGDTEEAGRGTAGSGRAVWGSERQNSVSVREWRKHRMGVPASFRRGSVRYPEPGGVHTEDVWLRSRVPGKIYGCYTAGKRLQWAAGNWEGRTGGKRGRAGSSAGRTADYARWKESDLRRLRCTACGHAGKGSGIWKPDRRAERTDSGNSGTAGSRGSCKTGRGRETGRGCKTGGRKQKSRSSAVFQQFVIQQFIFQPSGVQFQQQQR